MAIVSDIQFQDAAVKPAALDTSCSFLAASFTASTSMAVGGDSVSPTGLFTAKSTNNVEAYFETTNTNGTASIFLNNDARPMWELAVSGNTSDSFIISNCTGAGGTTHYNALSITPAGAIGLGKKSAASVLDIAYADSSTGGIILTETTNSITTKIVNEGSSGSVGTTSSHPLGFRTAGLTRGVFDTNGRLGIGTDAPDALLDVRGAAIFNQDGADVDFRIEGDTEANLFFVDASTDRVGIGTATPGALLNVVQDQNGATTLLINTNTAGTAAVAGIQLESDAGGGDLRIFSSSFTTSNYNIADALVLESFSTSSGGLQLATEGAHEIGVWTNSTRRATVTSGGCIGVGIQAPDGLIHVHAGTAGSVAADSTACNLVVENSTAGGVSILVPNASAASLVFGSPADALGAEIKHTQSTTTMEVGTKESGGILKLNSADGTNAVYIDASQNVGIGTATPGVPLRVEGNACFTGTLTAANLSGGGTSLWSSGTNIVYVTGNCIGIGTDDPGSNNILTAQCGQNASTVLKVLNDTGGTAAAAILSAYSNTSSGFLAAYSSSFTTANQRIADAVLVQSDANASAGLHLATATTAELALWTNNTRRMTITSAGCVGIGTATTSDVIFKVQGNSCTTGTVYAQTFSGGGVSDDVWTMNGQDAYYKELSAGDNIGIGTTTPAHTLHVGGNAASAPALLVCDSGGSRIEVNSGAVKINNAYTMPAADGSAGEVICTDGSDTLTFGPGGYWTCVSGPELYYTGGNVGIGTTDPIADLHVSAAQTPCITIRQSGGSADEKVMFRMQHGASHANWYQTLMSGTGDTGTTRLCGTVTGCGATEREWVQVKAQNTGAQIDFSGCRMQIWSTCVCVSGDYLNINGNVGIGTDAPSTNLEIMGAAGYRGDLTLSTAETTIVATDALGRIDFKAPLEINGSNAVLPTARIEARAAEEFTATHNQTDLLFLLANDGGVTEKLRMTSGGRLGIGTATPSHTLDVEGVAHASTDVCAERCVAGVTGVRSDGWISAGGNICSTGTMCSTGNICGKAMICADGVICSGTCLVAGGCILAGICLFAPRVCGNACVAGTVFCATTSVGSAGLIRSEICVSAGTCVCAGHSFKAESTNVSCIKCLHVGGGANPSSANDAVMKCYVDCAIDAQAGGVCCVQHVLLEIYNQDATMGVSTCNKALTHVPMENTFVSQRETHCGWGSAVTQLSCAGCCTTTYRMKCQGLYYNGSTNVALNACSIWVAFDVVTSKSY